AVPLFESGAVARWYKANGWEFPVQGPQAPGLGGIQQFFEALGLAKPPKVQLTPLQVRLQGRPGGSVDHVLKVTTAENRPVFAHATSLSPWLRVRRVSLEGRTARIQLVVPLVPAAPGAALPG